MALKRIVVPAAIKLSVRAAWIVRRAVIYCYGRARRSERSIRTTTPNLNVAQIRRGSHPLRIGAPLSTSVCRFYCLGRLKHSRTFLSRTRVTTVATERDRSRISLQSGQTSKPSHQCCQIVTVLFIDRLELQSQSATGLHVPHDSVGANLALLNKKMKIGRRANALWPGGLNEQSAYTEILHARQITISAAFPVDPYIVL